MQKDRKVVDKISVVVPVYNAEKTLRRCVESLVLGNHKEEIEIILVEDHSKDKSWDICLELQDEFSEVRAIQNSRNEGPSYTRNRGIDKATGDLLLFVDADDWVSCHYISSLFEQYKNYDDALVLCGYTFIVDNTVERKKYLYSDYEESIIIDSEADRFFKLMDRILFQQLWNKIFDLRVVKENGLHFNEELFMGEDTQFVLDYLKTSHLNRCVIINKPLYYYIRTDLSLMGKYNKVDISFGEKQLKSLLELSGENDPVVVDAYKQAVENNKRGVVYRIMHSRLSHSKKTDLIKKVYPEKKAEKLYQEYSKIVFKERLSLGLKKAKNTKIRLVNHLQTKKQRQIINQAKSDLKKKDVTVVSQNCIGGVFCHDMELEFSSPTVNLFFKADDFVKFVLNLEYYMSLPLCMKWGEEYPIGILDNIRIFFMHYHTCKDAVDSWERRKQRMDYSQIIVLCTDMEGFSEKTFEEWNKINYPKLLFTANQKFVNKDSLFFPEYVKDKHVPDLIPERKIYKEGRLINLVNKEGI